MRRLLVLVLVLVLVSPALAQEKHGEEHPPAHPPAGEAPHGGTGGGGGAGEHHGYGSIEVRALTVQLLGFTILAIILGKFAVPVAARALRGRSERIRGTLEGLERDEAQLGKDKAEAEQKLRAAEAGSIERMEAAGKEGGALRDVLVEEGIQQADRVARKAKLEAEIERQKMILELRNEVVELSMAAAAGTLQKTVDEGVQEQLVDRFLDEFDEVVERSGVPGGGA